MADPRIGRAVLEIVVDDRPVKFALNQVKDESRKTAEDVRGIGQAVNLAVWREFGQGVVSVLQTVVGGLVELGERGANVQNISTAFANLTSAVGQTGSVMLGEMRTATSGLVDDLSLMESANKALLLGLPVTSESMGTMAQAATVLGRAMGQDAKKSFDDLITALGRGSPLILDNLGITVRVSEANETYARSLNKSATELTEAEKKTAFYNAAMAAAAAKVAEIGGLHLTLSDRVQVARVTLQNFTDGVGVAMNQSPVLRAGMEVVGRAIQGAFGANQAASVRTLADHIDDFVIGLTYVAQGGAVVATVLVTAWYAIKTAILGAITAISGVATANVALLRGFVEMGTHIPIVGERVKGFADGARSLEDSLRGATAGLAAQTAEAARGVAGQSALQVAIDRVAGTVMNVRDAMMAAKGASADMASGVRRDLGNLGDDEARGRVEENTQKIAEAFLKLHEEIVLSTQVGIQRRLTELEFQKQREIQKLGELKELTRAEYDQMVLMVQEKYRLMSAAARAGADEIRDRTVTLQQEILLAQMTGTQQQLVQLAFKQDAELRSIEHLKTSHVAAYTFLATMIGEKYRLMTEQARGHFATVEQAAAAAGFKTRTELEASARRAEETYRRMLASGLFTESELTRARQAAAEAQMALDGRVTLNRQQQQEILLSSASTILRSMFGRSKSAAIAAALIDTAAAVAKALSAYPWPWNLAPAAAAAAAGYAQVQTIRAQQPQGFETGTPGLDFSNFGRVSFSALHGEEAVIPRGRGHMLAAEIAAAMPGDEGLGAKLDAVVAKLDELPRRIQHAYRNALLMTS